MVESVVKEGGTCQLSSNDGATLRTDLHTKATQEWTPCRLEKVLDISL